MSNQLYTLRHAYNVRILAFVLMENHFHLLVHTPDANLSTAMNHFMRETSRSIGRITGRINHIYGGRFRRSLIMSSHYMFNVYKYVYRNPVEAGECRKVEEYKFSTLHGLLGKSRLHIPVEKDAILFDGNPGFVLHWLNKKPSKKHYVTLKNALKKSSFALAKERGSTDPHPLEVELY